MKVLRNKEFSFFDFFNRAAKLEITENGPFRMFIEFAYDDCNRHKITEHTYVDGVIESGIVSIGDEVEIVGCNKKFKTTIEKIWKFRKEVTQAKRGDSVGIQLGGLYKNIERGMIIYSAGSIDPIQAEKLSKEYIKKHFSFLKKGLIESFFESRRRKNAAKKREEEKRLEKEKWERDSAEYQRQIESIKIDEPLTYKELCNKYPKFKELDYIVRNEKNIINLVENIAPPGLEDTVGSLTIFTGTPQTPKMYRHYPEYCIKVLRKNLKSPDWIPCFDGFDNSLVYNKKSNKFYYLDSSSPRPTPQLMSVSQYCKKTIQRISEDTKEHIEMEWDELEAEGLDYREVLDDTNKQIQKLKQLLRV